MDQRYTALAKDDEAIKKWLVLGVIQAELNALQGRVQALDKEHITEENRLNPAAGDRMSISGRDLVWRPVQLSDHVMDLQAILGPEDSMATVAYAVCYIHAEASRRGVRMLVGSDDFAKVFLNGNEVYSCREVRPLSADQDAVEDIVLQAGKNILVFKVGNWEGTWGGSIRLTDPEGNPLKGIKVTLTPE